MRNWGLSEPIGVKRTAKGVQALKNVDLLFYPEDGGSIFLRNVGKHLADYTSRPRRFFMAGIPRLLGPRRTYCDDILWGSARMLNEMTVAFSRHLHPHDF
jgi:hypothetical protein